MNILPLIWGASWSLLVISSPAFNQFLLQYNRLRGEKKKKHTQGSQKNEKRKQEETNSRGEVRNKERWPILLHFNSEVVLSAAWVHRDGVKQAGRLWPWLVCSCPDWAITCWWILLIIHPYWVSISTMLCCSIKDPITDMLQNFSPYQYTFQQGLYPGK